jgi:DNA polymerase alpha-associated DNA helicase A
MEMTLQHLRKTFVPMLDEADGASKLPSLVAVLLGLRKPSVDATSAELEYLDPSLNESQKAAARFALEAQELSLIHGPPGTGKTQTLVEVIRQLVQQGKRVLVCGASNLAVDNLVERLTLHQVKLTRIGHPARIMSSLYGATLDYQVAQSDAAEIVKDIKVEVCGWCAFELPHSVPD